MIAEKAADLDSGDLIPATSTSVASAPASTPGRARAGGGRAAASAARDSPGPGSAGSARTPAAAPRARGPAAAGPAGRRREARMPSAPRSCADGEDWLGLNSHSLAPPLRPNRRAISTARWPRPYVRFITPARSPLEIAQYRDRSIRHSQGPSITGWAWRNFSSISTPMPGLSSGRRCRPCRSSGVGCPIVAELVRPREVTLEIAAVVDGRREVDRGGVVEARHGAVRMDRHSTSRPSPRCAGTSVMPPSCRGRAAGW